MLCFCLWLICLAAKSLRRVAGAVACLPASKAQHMRLMCWCCCRFLQPMARAARLRGSAAADVLPNGSTADGFSLLPGPEDDVVALLERAKDSKSAAIRTEYLNK